MPAAGPLRQRLTLQQATSTPNSFNEMVESWTDVATVYGAVEPLRGQEFFAAEQVQSEISVRVRIRYRIGVAPTMRWKFGTRYLYINAVIDVNERHREIQCMCREMPNA